MSLRIRRGTEAQRTGVVFDSGELVVTTDEFRLFVGDGITQGGRNIAQNLAGSGITYNPTTGKLDVSGLSITTDDVPEGDFNKYFSNELAQDAVADALVNGTHQGITFIYNTPQDTGNRIDATVSLSLDNLTDVVITGTPTNGQVLKYNATAHVWEAGADVDTTGITAVVDDTTPELGGDLVLGSHDIIGIGNLDITGDIDTIGDIGITGSITAGGDIGATGNVTGNFIGTGTFENPVFFGTPFPPLVNNPEIALTGYGVTDGSSGGFIDLVGIRDSFEQKTNLQTGDLVGGFRIKGRIEGTNKPLAAISGIIAPTATLTDANPETDVIIAVARGNSSDFSEYKFSGGGDAFFPGAVVVGTYTSETLPTGSGAVPGMILLNTSTGKFQGYTNNTGSGNPGWVDLS